MKVVLASKSPRRLEILERHGICPIVIPSETEEVLPDNIGMTEAVEMLALQKASEVYNKIKDNKEYSDAVIIGADTIVYLEEIMGKPVDEADAYRMLDKIRNTEHYVATGVALIYMKTGKKIVFNDITTVYCKDYSDEDIYKYIKEEKPYDKAGSYAIQSSFGKHIDHIDGDYENVVGLPFYRIENLI